MRIHLHTIRNKNVFIYNEIFFTHFYTDLIIQLSLEQFVFYVFDTSIDQ